ncbi:hypothetical protein MAR_027659 [Mya arenaria]|uniref:Uncharacterized protein n=1 Tax=Mya arenaria TaxID=6604 RepID=A0ABY7EWY9_MYAAR|nr:hypothetical protein MAR_027659 [Mya arenaria]
MVHSDSPEMTHELQVLKNLKTLLHGVYSTSNVCLQDTAVGYSAVKSSLGSNRTAQLWLQYMDMVAILKRFIKAVRTGNWELHLMTMKEMLPFFAAAGRHLYLKTGWVYIQQMSSLQTTYKDVYDSFRSGHHVIRRADRFWAGLSTDLVIEQALMRSVKSAGGLTKGREMSEIQRVQWLLSMPACSDVNTAIQEYIGQRYETSDQHKDTQSSRVARDIKDTDAFLIFLKLRSPFFEQSKLGNIESGTVGEKNVNVDTAKRIGEAILKNMKGKTVASHSFKRSGKAVTLGTKNAVKIGDEDIYVDPQLLFQRLMTVSDASLDNPFEVFKYELSAVPAALFDSSVLMREAQKPSLANAIWELGVCGGEKPTENVTYVLDGGSLLHRIPWKHGDTFQEI